MDRASKQRPGTLRFTLLVIVLVLLACLIRAGLTNRPVAASLIYFTTDDGQTTFVDTSEHYPPFDHDGKSAVRAWMFSDDGGKTKYVGYLERFTAEAKTRIEAEAAEFKSARRKSPPEILASDTEIKRPGASNAWVKRTDNVAASEVTHFAVPSGADRTPEVELP